MAEEWIGAQVVSLVEETIQHHLSAENVWLWGCILYVQPHFHLACWKLHYVGTACYCDEKTSGVFRRLKVKKGKQTVFRYTKSCSWEAGNELYPLPLGMQWALITAREILAGHQGKHSDGKDREAQERIPWGEQRLCRWRPLRKG